MKNFVKLQKHFLNKLESEKLHDKKSIFRMLRGVIDIKSYAA